MSLDQSTLQIFLETSFNDCKANIICKFYGIIRAKSPRGIVHIKFHHNNFMIRKLKLSYR